MFTLTVNSDRLVSQLEALRKALGVDRVTILRDETIALSKTCVNFTPPFKSPGTAAGAKQIGEGAIERELKNFASEARPEFLTEVSRQWGVSDVRGFVTRPDRTKLAISFDHVDPDGGQIPIYHEENRDRRGKIPLERKIQGQWKAKVLTLEGARSAFTTQVQSRVGRWKATWAYAAHKLGAAIPGWISRHFGAISSLAIFDASGLSNVNAPSIIFGSRAPGNSRMASGYRYALQVRAKAVANRLKLMAAGYHNDIANRKPIRPHAQEAQAKQEQL